MYKYVLKLLENGKIVKTTRGDPCEHINGVKYYHGLKVVAESKSYIKLRRVWDDIPSNRGDTDKTKTESLSCWELY